MANNPDKAAVAEKAVILIVDDMPANIQILASCLKKTYRLKVATSGGQCLELAEAEPLPDLILLDINMPVMNGYEVCEALKNNPKTESIPVIFVTGNDDQRDEEHGLEIGAVDYITKPVLPAIVLARVNTHITLKSQRDKLIKMALHDQLTDLYNRYYLFETANHMVSRAVRHQHDMCLLMVDIDHFKVINDTHGHPVGDIVLQAVGQLLKQESRSEDTPARFGGEEFVIVLEHCNLQDAEIKANHLLKEIEALKPSGIHVTASMGLAQLDLGKETFSDLLNRADIAVYQAKEQGRNRVVIFSDKTA